MTSSAAIYCRISRDPDESSESIKRQEDDCRDHAERKGYEVAKVYTDRDESAYRGGGMDRPQYRALLEDLDQYDALIFWKLDRLVRRVVEFAKVMERAEEAGVTLVSVNEPLDTATGLGKGFASMVAGMGEQESDNISLRTRSAFRDKAMNGDAKAPGFRPFGYEADAVTVKEDEAELIRDAVDRIIGGEPYSRIAREWNEQGVRTTAGNDWHPTAFRRMLTNSRLAGKREYKGEVVGEGNWEPILTPGRQARLRRALDDLPTAWTGERQSHVLTSIVECGDCREPMVVAYPGGTAKGKRQYACKKRPAAEDACGSMAVTAKHAERVVREKVFDTLTGPLAERVREAARRERSEGEAQEIRQELSDLDAARQELAEAFADGGDAKAFRQATDRLAQREDELQDRLDQIESREADADAAEDLADLAEHVEQVWKDGDVPHRRELLHRLVRRVLVMPGTPGRFDRDRIIPDWRHFPPSVAEYQAKKYLDPEFDVPPEDYAPAEGDELRAILDELAEAS